jgi:hypothetical protein
VLHLLHNNANALAAMIDPIRRIARPLSGVS